MDFFKNVPATIFFTLPPDTGIWKPCFVSPVKDYSVTSIKPEVGIHMKMLYMFTKRFPNIRPD